MDASGSAYDGCIGVGRNHVVIAENFGVAIYDKSSGNRLSDTKLKDWFPHVPPEATLVFDPRVAYDQYADRFILLALAFDQPDPPLGTILGSWLLLTVSDGSDPTVPWHSTVLDLFSTGWADYPGLGIDEQAVYVTYNADNKTARLLVSPKTDLYAGTASFFAFFPKNPGNANALAVQPCHHFGATSAAYLVHTLQTTPANVVRLWNVTWSSGTPTLSPPRTVTVDAYASPTAKAEQLGEPKRLDVNGCRVRSAVCRADSVWLSFATAYGKDEWIAARWCRLNAQTGTMIGPAQELAADGAYYLFPALAVDAAGNVTMVASRSTKNEYPSLHYGLWPAAGSPSAGLLVKGAGPHLRCRGDQDCSEDSARNGWGDYNGIALDASDETTVWVFGGVGHKTDKKLWATTVALL
jgi:hypothetical protein